MKSRHTFLKSVNNNKSTAQYLDLFNSRTGPVLFDSNYIMFLNLAKTILAKRLACIPYMVAIQ